MKRYKITINEDTTDIGNIQELVVVLQALLGEEDRTVLMQLREHLVEIIGDSSGLYQLFKALEPHDHIFLIEMLGEDVRSLFSESKQLSCLFSFLSQPGTKSLLLQNLGEGFLRETIHDPEELSEILEWVYEEDDMILLKMLGEGYNRTLYHNGAELSMVLHNINIEVQEWYLNFIGIDLLSELTMSWKDLALLLRALPHDLGCMYLAKLKPDKLSALIRNRSEWKKLSGFLEPEEEDYLKEMMGSEYAK